MPVTSIALAAFAMLLLGPALAHAQTRVLVKHAHQLERAPEVKALRASFEALTSAYVLQGQCAKELAVTEAQTTTVSEHFLRVAREYQIAYQDAFIGYVGAPPSQALVDDVAASIKTQQKTVANNMALAIRKFGCADSRFRNIRKYVDGLVAAPQSPPSEAKTLAPKVRF